MNAEIFIGLMQDELLLTLGQRDQLRKRLDGLCGDGTYHF